MLVNFIVFGTSLFSHLLIPRFFPSVHLLFFAPYLVFILKERSLIFSLGQAILVGVIIDLFQSSPRFGIASLGLALATFVLFRKKQLFKDDHFLNLPLMTIFYSLCVRLINRILYFIFGLSFTFLPQIGYDLFVMPLIDGLFALIVFQLPLHFKKRKKIVEDSL